eukprot:TRINITY_DN1242_c0_g1_i1.p1 TRINITY_DN1242_c0_g1~~TRINITY_DN1242_c0_g1_i1.p1  ORF type:complete len:275 (-),score=41.10 TRINITY_DN1242_c0_g1_i1:95-919(-)
MMMADTALAYMDSWRWDPPSTLASTIAYPIVASLAYAVVISGLKAFMRKRAPCNIRSIQLVYNAAMVLLSVLMCVGMIIACIRRAQTMGAMSVVCEPTDEPLNGMFGFVIYVFYLSKFVELFDTVQLVLKKKPTIPLHLFHHVTMLYFPYTWLADSWTGGAWWCVIVNSLVHTFMYYYYFRAAQGYDVWWKKYLTQGQIVQFFTGFLLISYWFWIRNDAGCKGGVVAASLAHAGNTILIVMFIKFFIDTYTKPSATPPAGQKKKDTHNSKPKTS